MDILIIDDERSIRNTLKDILETEGYTVAVAEDGLRGLELLKTEKFDLIFCDVKMPKMDGIEVLTNIKKENPDQTVVMISGHGTIDTAVESLKLGAFDFIEKPLDLNRLLVCVRNGLERKTLVQETKTLKKKISKDVAMVGHSPAMEHLRSVIERVAGSNAKVLITGENGTGKEVVAKMLFMSSNRSGNPYVEVNCAAIPSELIESELFGHEKGSFTSAVKQRIGKFEQANGGTLFLDEIGDMSLAAQTKVLRALQEGEITRVGSDKSVKVDVRVFAATNKDLLKEIEKGNFREDLYHRLSVILIHVPPLRERLEDIPDLVNHFLGIICEEQGISKKSFTDDAMEEMKKYRWSGNIRELRNAVERMVILCGNEITVDDVKQYASPTSL
ncbi:MAG: sigma-54 dependent transcriptional regulator [Paludibacteraceae bacterium]|nr:sigma-54 dependent transcriptional regulator [Paludibacteraceae bacterium]